jgi:hypothetical protein
LKPNDPYRGRTAPLTSKRCILYICSTNIGTEYFKQGIYAPFFFSSKCSLFHNSNVFGSCFIHILYTECAKIKKNNSGAKRLRNQDRAWHVLVVLQNRSTELVVFVSFVADQISIMGELGNETLSEVLGTYNCDGDEHFNRGLCVLL